MSDLLSPRAPFLRACRGEPVARRPVWLMRQAGRYLPEYQEIRRRVDFLTLCKTPELAAEVTVQPVQALGVDAAILFADILLPLEAMGVEVRFTDGQGPVLPQPLRGAADLARLRTPDVLDALGYVLETVRLARARLADAGLADPVPLIGFAGAPWTLAAYLVEGGVSRSFSHLLGWSYRDPAGLTRLLDLLAATTAEYLRAQVAAGAQALQIFDTWGGLLDRWRWRELARPSLLQVLAALGREVPLLYYVRNGAHLLPELRELPIDVLSVDWRLPLSEVRAVVGPELVLQGNLDPAALLSSPEEIWRQVRTLLAEGRGGGHIVNLGHGVLPSTPVANARAFVDAVRELSPPDPDAAAPAAAAPPAQPSAAASGSR